MTVEIPRPQPTRRQRNRLGRPIPGWTRRGYRAEHVRSLSVGGRVLRVAIREGGPGWPPLLLCNGIGASLELLQPFVDALHPRRLVIRFDMPGIGGSPAPVVPYHLHTLAPLLTGLLAPGIGPRLLLPAAIRYRLDQPAAAAAAAAACVDPGRR